MALERVALSYGSDPELFFKRNGHVIGSEKVIGKGLRLEPEDEKCIIVVDGVQAELNPPGKTSVRALGDQISMAFRRLRWALSADHAVKCCWDILVEVSRNELDSLSPESRILGCKPSRNIYGVKPILVDAKLYRKRSAAGHLHLGLTGQLFTDRISTVAPMDILVGNTCVMLDRDMGNKERRENYGRAGEYRLPNYGIEYRTVSNFWLRSFALMDFVFGMATLAASIVNMRVTHGDNMELEMAKAIDINDIVAAIDKNDSHLARKNFEKLIPFLQKHLPNEGFPLNPQNIDRFLLFTESVQEFGMELFFPEDPVDHWADGKKIDFRTFLERTV